MESNNLVFSILITILIFSGILYSIIIHEISHVFVAQKLGDDTAKLSGRLSFNPIVHIDLFGTIILPLLLFLFNLPIFGWAKPVPVNPNKMENPKLDFFIASLAGPLTNLLVAILLGLILRFFQIPTFIHSFLVVMVQINLILMVFNILPIPPLDGSKVLGLFMSHEKFFVLQQYGMYILFGVILLSSAIPIIPFIINRVVSFFFGLITGIQVTDAL